MESDLYSRLLLTLIDGELYINFRSLSRDYRFAV
jgi:hypothetical protein